MTRGTAPDPGKGAVRGQSPLDPHQPFEKGWAKNFFRFAHSTDVSEMPIIIGIGDIEQ